MTRLGLASVEESHRSRLRTNPDLESHRVEVKRDLLAHLRLGVAGGKNFNADFR
jgi:hypothetical protein